MTPDEAHAIIASILRDRAEKCEDPPPCQDCALEAQALAALRQQADEHVTVTTDESGECVAVTVQDSEHRILRTVWVAPDKQAGQAEPVAWTWPIGKRGKDEPRHNWAISHRRPPNGFGGENAEPLYTAPPRARVSDKVISALAKLLLFAESQICQHDETKRGGAIWEICEQCGAQWADDRGGKPEFEWPKEIVEARAALRSLGLNVEVEP